MLEDSLSFFTSGEVGHFNSRNQSEAFEIEGQNLINSQDVPLVVLVGPNTVSFGEIFSGILQEKGRAAILGETTSGNVEILYSYDLLDGSRLWLAQETFLADLERFIRNVAEFKTWVTTARSR